MDIRFDTIATLNELLIKASATVDAIDGELFDPMVKVADPRHADFQANGVLPYAKKHKCNPRELGQKLLDALCALSEFESRWFKAELAGPGFLNIHCSTDYRLEWLKTFSNQERISAETKQWHKHRVLIDFSSPNTAKRMHVGHIRSTVIGEATSRLLTFCGADITKDNHIGDWGTQFGLLIHGIKAESFDFNADYEDIVGELERIYKSTHKAAQEDEAVMSAARNELVKLQQGDAENMQLWNQINACSMDSFNHAYQQLNVHFDKTLGESFYRDKVQRVYDELIETQIAEESDGALVVFHPEHPRFNTQPFIIRKSDGASNYASTDLATALYRVEHFQAEEIIYLTDARQSDHFEQLFLTLKKWFTKKGYTLPRLRHITFGTILGEDGKAIKTRSGEPVQLAALLEESVQRAQQIVEAKNPNLDASECKHIAETVGISALKYADLMQNRSTNYTFSWDKMLSFDGNTAPYLLYAAARIHSLFKKAGQSPEADDAQADAFTTEGENQLARKLLQFPMALQQAMDDLRPHFLCNYLYEVAGDFSTFYNTNRILDETGPTRARRLLLCARTLCTLEIGLSLLSINTLERM